MRGTGWEGVVGWFLTNRLVVFVFVGLLVGAGLVVSPFGGPPWLPRSPVPVDALPDIGDNQQIVFTEWPGRSPRDVEDQVTYPLTTALLGLPGVRTVRSSSALGFSSVHVLFEDEVEFYWSRSRVLEKLASLPPGLLPDDVRPTLGPDATALGQVFWYTLEGRSPDGAVVGGWDPDELRSIQDWTVRPALLGVSGVSEVASIGGFVREVQVDVDPDALRAHGVTLPQVVDAVRRSNLDVGARTLEVNGVEYLVRGVGFVEELGDVEAAVVATRDHTPVRVGDVGRVQLGPALRRGALDDAGAPAVGGVVVARYRANPTAVIDGLKERIATLAPGLPARTLEDGTRSRVTIAPFYDRSVLVGETLGTLGTALTQQVLVTVLVVLVLLGSLRSSLLISAVLPLGVLGAFLVMRATGVDANIMALGGIAIAIGTMVDIGIVFVENIEQHLAGAADRRSAVRRAAAEVAPAVVTSVLTTIVGFLPVFALTESELRLFGPLAVTKTVAMTVALVLGLVVLPAAALLVLRAARPSPWAAGLRWAAVAVVAVLLVADWMPLGPGPGLLLNLGFAGVLLVGVLGGFRLFELAYPRILATLLEHKALFLVLPVALVVAGTLAWRSLGREYMPPFDEGSFLYMPTTMPHASIGEALDLLSRADAAIASIPEVDRVVGKLGRVDSALDPAPVSMIETLVTYVPEYRTDPDGTRVRQWRDAIRSPSDIWDEIVRVTRIPGLTGAPVLMPIEARLVMLQSGMRAPMGVKVRGPDLSSIEAFGLALEDVLKGVSTVKPGSVFADRVVGKPYLEIQLDRVALGRYGLRVADVQDVLTVALGGRTLTRTVEGRERYGVRVRYAREERDDLEALQRLSVPAPGGVSVPLDQLAELRMVRGPQVIKAEDTFPTSYVLFDRQPDVAEVDAVQEARAVVEDHIARGALVVPAGVSWEFAGTYANQVRSEQRLLLLVPLALALVFVLLYLQFHRVSTAAIIGSGVLVAVSGGFLLLWLYGQPGFLGGLDGLRDVFQVGTVNVSVAVWVGVIALMGIAVDDGVVMATLLAQAFRDVPTTVAGARERTLQAGTRRVRACLMTTATTLLALLPVITSTGRGSDIMVPMALPMVGGMTIALITLFVVPVLYCAVEERGLARAEVA